MDAVIMTGGKGMRMAPYTKVLPKGLLPVGEQPILEIIVKQLKYYGFDSITMACGYLAPLIKTFFGNGSRWDVSIQYQIEDQPLGTAGPLKLLEKQLNKQFLVINCDVLTTLDLREFRAFHGSGSSLLTIASQKRVIPIEFGVLETDADRVTNFVEKPVRTACVSMGIYMMDPEVLEYVPDRTFFDIPDLIHSLLNAGKVVRHYENDAFWLDIGRPADYTKANECALSIAKELLPGDEP